MNLIQTIEAEQIAKFNESKQIPEFRAGDTLRVGVRVVEGERTRVQNYEGVCIARIGGGLHQAYVEVRACPAPLPSEQGGRQSLEAIQ